MRLTVFGVLLLMTSFVLLRGPLAPKPESFSEVEEVPAHEWSFSSANRTPVVPAKPMPEKLSPTEPTPKSLEEPRSLTPEEFRKSSEEVLRSLPTRADLKNLTAEEVHQTPRQLREAGRLLGKLAEMTEAQPELKNEAQEFYSKCFQKSELPVAVRGLCLARHRILRSSFGDQAEWNDEEASAPEEVQRLASLIPTVAIAQ